jgi:hypothetical protein
MHDSATPRELGGVVLQVMYAPDQEMALVVGQFGKNTQQRHGNAAT